MSAILTEFRRVYKNNRDYRKDALFLLEQLNMKGTALAREVCGEMHTTRASRILGDMAADGVGYVSRPLIRYSGGQPWTITEAGREFLANRGGH